MSFKSFNIDISTGGISCVLSIVRPVSHKYHLISSLKTWPNAQQYCRKNFDDLATIASDSDYARIKKQIIKDRVSSFIWLGMYNDVNSWRWSYNEISLKDTTLSKWAEYEPANIGGHEWCVTIDTFGNWRDYTCTIPRPFVCLNGESRSQFESTPMSKYTHKYITNFNNYIFFVQLIILDHKGSLASLTLIWTGMEL